MNGDWEHDVVGRSMKDTKKRIPQIDIQDRTDGAKLIEVYNLYLYYLVE